MPGEKNPATGPSAAYDGPVLATRHRSIEEVPAALVCIYADEGKLVVPPFTPEDGPGYRRPKLSDIARLRWFVSTGGRIVDTFGALLRLNGAVAVEPRYDFHACADVLEIATLTGSPRACRELLHYVRQVGINEGRRVVGAVESRNERLGVFLQVEFGAKPSRVFYEDHG